MCKSLVTLEVYDNERIAFSVFENLKNETGLSWSMYKKAPDEYGHTLYEIYGMFDLCDVECARYAVNNETEAFGL
jgi:hypothetical protein